MRLLLVLLIACSSSTSSKSSPSNAPSTTACSVDLDCTIAEVGPDPENLCCDITMTAAPVTKAYLSYVADWRKQHCEPKPVCKPLALPGHPLPCAFQPRCVAGSCSNRC